MTTSLSAGNRFDALRTGNGQDADGRRGVSGDLFTRETAIGITTDDTDDTDEEG
jgi:hypothetical protein